MKIQTTTKKQVIWINSKLVINRAEDFPNCVNFYRKWMKCTRERLKRVKRPSFMWSALNCRLSDRAHWPDKELRK